MSGRAFAAGMFVIGAIVVGIASRTTAAPSSPDQAATSDAARTITAPIRPASLEQAGDCSRPRKRLWVEGEGWVVRKVTICR